MMFIVARAASVSELAAPGGAEVAMLYTGTLSEV
jgi:hypothetical protein